MSLVHVLKDEHERRPLEAFRPNCQKTFKKKMCCVPSALHFPLLFEPAEQKKNGQREWNCSHLIYPILALLVFRNSNAKDEHEEHMEACV